MKKKKFADTVRIYAHQKSYLATHTQPFRVVVDKPAKKPYVPRKYKRVRGFSTICQKIFFGGF